METCIDLVSKLSSVFCNSYKYWKRSEIFETSRVFPMLTVFTGKLHPGRVPLKSIVRKLSSLNVRFHFPTRQSYLEAID